MPPAEIEPEIPASERLQIHALDRAATGIGTILFVADSQIVRAAAIRPASQTTRRIMSPLRTDLEEPNSLTHNFVMKSVASCVRPLATPNVPCLTYLCQLAIIKLNIKAKFSLSTS